jgi:hypothetical protein
LKSSCFGISSTFYAEVARSGWLSAVSASSRLFDLNSEATNPSKKDNSAIITDEVRRFSHTDMVFGTHRYVVGT